MSAGGIVMVRGRLLSSNKGAPTMEEAFTERSRLSAKLRRGVQKCISHNRYDRQWRSQRRCTCHHRIDKTHKLSK